MARFRLATYSLSAKPENTTTHRVDGVVHYVDRVEFRNDAEIVYQKYKKDYSGRSERPFMLCKSRRQFKTLDAAVKARIKEQP